MHRAAYRTAPSGRRSPTRSGIRPSAGGSETPRHRGISPLARMSRASCSRSHAILGRARFPDSGLPVSAWMRSAPYSTAIRGRRSPARSSIQRIACRKGIPARSTGTNVSRCGAMHSPAIRRVMGRSAIAARIAATSASHHAPAGCSCHNGRGFRRRSGARPSATARPCMSHTTALHAVVLASMPSTRATCPSSPLPLRLLAYSPTRLFAYSPTRLLAYSRALFACSLYRSPASSLRRFHAVDAEPGSIDKAAAGLSRRADTEQPDLGADPVSLARPELPAMGTKIRPSWA